MHPCRVGAGGPFALSRVSALLLEMHRMEGKRRRKLNRAAMASEPWNEIQRAFR